MENKQEKGSKNSSFFITAFRGLAFPIFSIVIAIFIAVFFVMWAKGYSIFQYFSALGDLFRIIWKGSFGNERKALVTVEFVTPLLFTGVANAIAFKCGLFNIGVEGQFIIGTVAAALLGLIPGLSPVIHIPLVMVGGIAAGALWASIPGYLKARVGINEVINTIMMNYIGINVANWIILKSGFGVPNKSYTPVIQESAQLLRFSNISRANTGIFIGIAVAFFLYWLLTKTTIGYEIRAVGLNPHGAEYGGINIAKNTILAMALSGGIAGIGGAVQVSGIFLQAQNYMGFTGYGFDGIAVALLAKNNPVGCIPAALLFGMLNSSSGALQLNNIPKQIVALVQAVIIIFVATDYIVRYFSEKKKKGAVMNG